MNEKHYWKICCQEKELAGLWQRWFKNQCVAIGWRIRPGITLDGPTESRGWARARNVLKQIKPGLMILVQLKDNRVGRVGEVVRTEFDKWNPLVPVPTSFESVFSKLFRLARRVTALHNLRPVTALLNRPHLYHHDQNASFGNHTSSFNSLLPYLQRRTSEHPARNSPNGERQCQQEPRKKFF